METKIYVLKDCRTSEVRYVGCTKNIEQRFKNHLNKAKDLNTLKRKWLEELRVLNLKPILEVIEIINETNYLEREKYWIKYYREQKCNLTNTGDITTNGNETSFKKGENGVSIVALQLDGTFFNSYSSILLAEQETNINGSNIWSVLNKRTKTAGKLIWIYEDEYYDLTEEDINTLIYNALDNSKMGGKNTQFVEGFTPWNKGKKGKLKHDKHVFQYSSITGLFIKEWNTAKQVNIELAINEESIGQCCRGKSKTAGGYIWSYIKYEYIEPPKYIGKTKQSIINNLK